MLEPSNSRQKDGKAHKKRDRKLEHSRENLERGGLDSEEPKNNIQDPDGEIMQKGNFSDGIQKIWCIE